MIFLRRVLALAAVAGLGFIAVEPPAATEVIATSEASTVDELFSPLPPSSPDAAPALLARSPFAPDHAAFMRQAAPADAVEHVPVVRLAAIVRVGEALRATLVIDGQETTVQEGDPTPAGRVTSVTESSVTLEGRVEALSLFR